MKYWAGLNNPADRDILLGGANALIGVVMNMMPDTSTRRRALQDTRCTEDSGEIVNSETGN
jgi:hypothetical protein